MGGWQPAEYCLRPTPQERQKSLPIKRLATTWLPPSYHRLPPGYHRLPSV